MTVSEELLELRRKLTAADRKVAQLEEQVKLASQGKICSNCLKEFQLQPTRTLGPVSRKLLELVSEVDEIEAFCIDHECET